MVIGPAGLRTKKDCAGEAQLQLQITGTTSCQRGRSIIKIYQMYKYNFYGSEKKMVACPRWRCGTKMDWPIDRRL
jgi:hypothetical protein